jgi:hypothetical protein
MSKKAKGHAEELVAPPPFDPTVMVRLIASDDYVFYVDRNCARISKVVRNLVPAAPSAAAPGAAALTIDTAAAGKQTNSKPAPPGQEVAFLVDPASAAAAPDTLGLATVKFPFLTAKQLETAIKFMCYKYRYDSDAPDHRPPMPSPATPQEQLELLSLAMHLQI